MNRWVETQLDVRQWLSEVHCAVLGPFGLLNRSALLIDSWVARLVECRRGSE